MVRTVRHCDACKETFGFPFCASCKGLESMTSRDVLPTLASPKRRKTANDEDLKGDDNVAVDVDLSSDRSTGMASEGGDDFHCTQIVDDELSLNETNSSVATPHDSSIDDLVSNRWSAVAGQDTQNKDICFICGVSLLKLRNRVDHIKRCSKKHGVTGADAPTDANIDAILKQQPRPSQNGTKKMNPYLRDSKGWHEGAQNNLDMAAVPASKTSKQLSMNSFVQAPVRDVNNVLLAGAKRDAEKTKILAAAKASEKSGFHNGRRRRRSWGNRPKKNPGVCPAYKKITGTDFICDGFYYANSKLSANYFLTHFHSDHYGGIDSNWCAGTIYCSLATANLVNQQLGVDKKYIHPLPMLTPTVIASQGRPVTVTLLDANHCPGAVMFLFEVGKKWILHVGDFRWNRQIMLEQPPIREFSSQQKQLDELFLDTTYCNSKYTLPSQMETINETIAVVKRQEDEDKLSKKRTLHLFGAYTIGKERIYLSVAKHFGWKVYVDANRLRILSAFGWPEERMRMFTTRPEESRLWVVPLGHLNMKKLPDYVRIANSKPFAKPFSRIAGYRPTGWSMGAKPSDGLLRTRSMGEISIHSVPYSEHSSYDELVDCLEILRPKKIIPTVSVSSSEAQISTLMKGLKEKQTRLTFKTRDLLAEIDQNY